ncbi:MAG: type III pantothenate kinase [Clostridiales bacterium]|nr:type III pantothenate kinase [Clostridiales bacterium]
MLLAIDIGNSHIVLGIIEGEEILDSLRMYTDPKKTEDQLAAEILQLLRLAGYRAKDFDGSIISCVVPQLGASVRGALAALLGLDPVVVGAGIKTGLNIRIDHPAELGADMACTAVAALHRYGAPCVVVDMGTATKLSVLDKNGALVGGAICPGMALSAEALSQGASLLPRVSLSAPAKAIGTGTVSCMQSGIVFGAASMIDGMLARFFEELGYTATVIATGGLAPLIAPHCVEDMELDEDLIFEGMRILWERNRP